jgi:hypothetical protein
VAAFRAWRCDIAAGLFLLLLPALVHLPALTGWHRFDPLFLMSGVTVGASAPAPLLAGYPGWIDGNSGVTVEALGALAARDWLHGILPWWNPYSGVGLPLAAEAQNAAFFLPFMLLLALPHGLLALRMVLMALAGLCTRALLRRLGCAGMPALVGAALFELNGTFAWLAHGPIMPIAFLPMLLLGIEQARDGRRWPPLAIPLGIGWSLLSGFPETAFIDGLFALAWAVLRLSQAEFRVRYALCVAGGGTLGLMLAAPGIWPFVESLPRSFLSVHEGANMATLLPANLALLLFPTLYGNLFMGFVRLGQQTVLWFKTGGFCDLTLVAMALLGLRWRAPDRVLRWVLAGWVVVTLGRAAGVPFVTDAFVAVPVLRQAVFHLYVLPSWSMALCVLAALALQDWIERRSVAPYGAVVFAALLGAGALWLGRDEAALLWHGVADYWVFPAASVAVAAGMLALVVLCWRRAATNRRRIVLGGALVAHAGVLFALPLLAGPHGGHLDAGSIRFLQEQTGLARVVSFGPLVPNYGAMFGIAEVGHNYLPLPQSWVDYVRRNFHPDMDGVNFYEGWALPGDDTDRLLAAYQRAGAAFALTLPGAVPNLAGAALVRHGEAMDIWRLPNPTPYFQAPGCTLSPGSRLRLTVDCPAPAMLTRLELASPGWRATRDGIAADLGTADIFQTLPLPAGRSEIAFRYAPPWIGFAWAAFAIGAVALACGALLLNRAGTGRRRLSEISGSP